MYSVTGVQTSLHEDLSLRKKRYLVSMSIRTVCFMLSVVTHGWLRWVFVGFAVFLPYIAVVMANAGRTRTPQPQPYRPARAGVEGSRARRIGP